MANANATRDWRIYADFAQRLIGIARTLYADEPFGVDPTNTACALDSTTLDLSLSLFPWAPFRTTKAAVKLHTLLDLRGNIPSFIHISDGKLRDRNGVATHEPRLSGRRRRVQGGRSPVVRQRLPVTRAQREPGSVVWGVAVIALLIGLEFNSPAGVDLLHTIAHGAAQHVERGPAGAVAGPGRLNAGGEHGPADLGDRAFTLGHAVEGRELREVKAADHGLDGDAGERR